MRNKRVRAAESRFGGTNRMAEADQKAERSRLLNKQKEERSAAEKALKKAKGALADAARTKLEELEELHAQQIAEFDGKGGDDAKKAKGEKAGKVKIYKDTNWEGLSKKELEAAASERDLGKKGSREELICKLRAFHLEQAKMLADNPQLAKAAESSSQKGHEAVCEAAPNPVEEEEDEEEEDEADSSEEEGDVVDEAADVSAEEAEKQLKREQLVRKALRHVLLKSGPFALDEMPKAMESVVKGFAPEILGYSSLRKFAKQVPKKFMIFDKKENMCHPPEK